ncbi:MAG: hypothetical protein KKI09_02105 [Spirochaetes bacterium]|nr:hypothetical protein [Spirochaetota bacterium]
MHNDTLEQTVFADSPVIYDDEAFIKQVERLIDPPEVSDLNAFQRFKKLLPTGLFKKILARASRKSPYIGFIVEPYSLFLFFRLKDIEKARSMLPERYELVKTAILEGDEPDYYFGTGIFNTKSSTFWGSRLECYLIALDKETGLLSWVFIDILSNTLIALPTDGVADRNCRQAIYTTNGKADFFVDFIEDCSGRRLCVRGNLGHGRIRRPVQPLWIGGNNSVAHSLELADGLEDPFAVIFDPAEVASAHDLPLHEIQVQVNTLFPGLAEDELRKVVCFPFAQHYIADSPGCRTYVRDEADMVRVYHKLTEQPIPAPFPTGPIKRIFLAGLVFSWMAILVLFVLLLIK